MFCLQDLGLSWKCFVDFDSDFDLAKLGVWWKGLPVSLHFRKRKSVSLPLAQILNLKFLDKTKYSITEAR